MSQLSPIAMTEICALTYLVQIFDSTDEIITQGIDLDTFGTKIHKEWSVSGAIYECPDLKTLGCWALLVSPANSTPFKLLF
jgi:hypothetical protein